MGLQAEKQNYQASLKGTPALPLPQWFLELYRDASILRRSASPEWLSFPLFRHQPHAPAINEFHKQHLGFLSVVTTPKVPGHNASCAKLRHLSAQPCFPYLLMAPPGSAYLLSLTKALPLPNGDTLSLVPDPLITVVVTLCHLSRSPSSPAYIPAQCLHEVTIACGNKLMVWARFSARRCQPLMGPCKGREPRAPYCSAHMQVMGTLDAQSLTTEFYRT